ncbi:aldehyde dehydrogenase family protein [Rhodococcus erythropolis]|uniref:aldehyde dehydrogenase family protein n=1 Tax=Rhodococcus erythropolis TaxID=1833 RepID=UPI00294A7E46|nr:aldehyde dehydrogenase family protein [Rhodococcus erythropolis]MDV6211952.1 aldehyde dehydrogenase family protein [Rhodococcus erythropolis]
MTTKSAAPQARTNENAIPTVELVRRELAVARFAFDSGRTRSLTWRTTQLEGLLRLIDENEGRINTAIEADLGRGSMATFMADIAPVRHEIRHTLKHLERWAAPTTVPLRAAQMPGKAWVTPEPKGVVLVIGAWNFPVLLTLHPLVSALAAGNAAIVKPSELSPATAELLAELLPRYVDPNAVRVLQGDATLSSALVTERFDHVFFTGSTTVGRAILEASAKHLTPVTLELGGKSPVIVAKDADIVVAARRIAWAKAVNGGQACIAPDYVLVEESVRAALVERLLKELPRAAGLDSTRIVNDRHLDRLESLLDGHGGERFGGQINRQSRTITPAVITDPDPSSQLMQEEIFGPILPIITVRDIEEAVAFVNGRPKPLALYLFTESRTTECAVTKATSSGSIGINHLMYQLLVPELPFGGIGESGTGSYHGKNGFDTFSHHKSVLRKPSALDLSFAYPPYGKLTTRVFRRLMG